MRRYELERRMNNKMNGKEGIFASNERNKTSESVRKFPFQFFFLFFYLLVYVFLLKNKQFFSRVINLISRSTASRSMCTVYR